MRDPATIPEEADDALARRVLVFLLPLVAVAIAVAVSASDVHTKRLFDNVHWTLSYGGAAVLAWLGVRRASPGHVVPKQWFAWALTAYVLGQVLWDLQVASGWNPFPGPSDLFYVSLGPLTAIGLIKLLSGSAGKAERRAAALDSAGLTVAVLALTLALYLPRRGDNALLQISFLVAYPVFLCWAACTALIAMFALRLRIDRGLLLFLVGLFGNAGLWLEWNSRTLDNALADGTWYNALFSVAALCQGMGVYLLWPESSTSPRWERFSERVRRLLPLFIVVVCAVAVVLAFTLPHVPVLVGYCAVGGGLVVVVLATIRQSVLLSEREKLIEAERSLRKAEDDYRVLVEQAADGIFIADASGTYQTVNTRGAEMLGMTREEVIGKNIADIVAPSELHKVSPEVQTLLAGETVRSAWLMARKDGSHFQAEVTAKMLSDGRLQGIVRDVSDRLALEAQLRQSQKMQAIGALSAGIAHDFNNILAAIVGNAALAAEDVGEGHAALQSIRGIEQAAQRAAELVQRIVSFSRPREPVTEPVDLRLLVDEVIKLLRPALPAGVALRTIHSAAPRVAADPAQLHQVLMNLCTNAWQAFGGHAGTIEVRTEEAELLEALGPDLPAARYARLVVSDDGEGMLPETLERAFEPFFTTKSIGKGTGLGLSVVHGIVQGHRGALRVKSTLGRGAEFSIYLPALAADPAFLKQAAESRQSQPASVASARVAYVDDEQVLLTTLVLQLKRRGYAASGFRSGEQLLEALVTKQERFDVVVTDYSMPHMSGLDLIRAVATLGIRTNFVLTSGYLTDELRGEAGDLGVRYFVKKPDSIDALCSAIDQALRDARRATGAAS